MYNTKTEGTKLYGWLALEFYFYSYSLLLEIIATSFLVIVVAQKALVGPGTFLQEDGRLIRSRILKMNIQRDTRQNLTILYSLDTFNRFDNSR